MLKVLRVPPFFVLAKKLLTPSSSPFPDRNASPLPPIAYSEEQKCSHKKHIEDFKSEIYQNLINQLTNNNRIVPEDKPTRKEEKINPFMKYLDVIWTDDFFTVNILQLCQN